MLEILAITGPIFLLIGTGFVAVRSGLLDRAGIRPMGVFVVNFALPAMLFKAMAERRLDEALNWDMVIAYGLGSLLMVALTVAFTCLVQRRDLLTGAVFSMGTAMANSSFVGFPIALQLFGHQAAASLAAFAVVESVLMFPLLYVLGDAAASGRQPLRVLLSSIVARLVKNPFLLSLAAGAAWAASEVAMPAPIGRAVTMLASTSAPVALFCIGGILPAVMQLSPSLQAFGLGLWFPGAGFLALGPLGSLATIATLLLFAGALIAWFGAGMVVAPVLVWIGGAFLAGAAAQAEPWAPAPFIVGGLTVAGYVISRFRSARRDAADIETRNRRNAFLPAAIERLHAERSSRPVPGARELDENQLQHLRYALDRALQPIESFGGFDRRDQFQTAATRYQINTLAYAIGLACVVKQE